MPTFALVTALLVQASQPAGQGRPWTPSQKVLLASAITGGAGVVAGLSALLYVVYGPRCAPAVASGGRARCGDDVNRAAVGLGIGGASLLGAGAIMALVGAGLYVASSPHYAEDDLLSSARVLVTPTLGGAAGALSLAW